MLGVICRLRKRGAKMSRVGDWLLASAEHFVLENVYVCRYIL